MLSGAFKYFYYKRLEHQLGGEITIIVYDKVSIPDRFNKIIDYKQLI